MISQLFNMPYDGSGVSIKIIPDPSSCNCLRCRRDEWNNIQHAISDHGSLTQVCDNEGYFTLVYINDNILLETHESGPEIITLITPLIELTSAIIGLVTVVIMCFKTNNKNGQYHIRIREYRKHKLLEDISVTVGLHATDEEIEKKVKGLLDSISKRK